MPVVAQTQYATTADLYVHGAPAATFNTPATSSPATQQAALDAASAEFESYAAGQYTLPLLKWGVDVVRSICAVATWELMCVRGFNPEGEDGLYFTRAKSMRAWWEKIAQGIVSPPSIVDSAQDTMGVEGGPMVTSDTPRGWPLPSSGNNAFNTLSDDEL